MTVREVPLAEAAERLGLTTEALRQRLKRGKTLRGTKRPDGWYVQLDQSQLAGRPVTTSSDQPPPTVNGHDQSQPDAATDPDRTRLDAVTSQLVDVLAAEVADLRQANSELRRLLALALQTRALPAPRDEPIPTDGVVSRPWWARWRAWWRR